MADVRVLHRLSQALANWPTSVCQAMASSLIWARCCFEQVIASEGLLGRKRVWLEVLAFSESEQLAQLSRERTRNRNAPARRFCSRRLSDARQVHRGGPPSRALNAAGASSGCCRRATARGRLTSVVLM